MPITINISRKNVERVRLREDSVFTSSKRFLDKVASQLAKECVDVIQCSLEKERGTALLSSENGFVYSLTMAYNCHYNLTIRPEDVWPAILTQFRTYVNKHAEELRGKFVAHEGQNEPRIDYDKASRYDVDIRDFAIAMGHELSKHVIDEELRDWIMPAFSTTTLNDTVVASIVMMGSMQKYLSYTTYTLCGIPNVTLLGDKQDWEDILRRLDKLNDWGEETTRFAEFLKPIVRGFILSFEKPTSKATFDFWQHVASYISDESGTDYSSGWITAFCFWGKDGERFHTFPHYSEFNEDKHYYCLDGVVYPRVDTQEIPPGWISVPVKVVELKQVYNIMMVARMVGIQCGPSSESSNRVINSASPKAGWWTFEVDAPDDENAEPGSLTKIYPYVQSPKLTASSARSVSRT